MSKIRLSELENSGSLDFHLHERHLIHQLGKVVLRVAVDPKESLKQVWSIKGKFQGLKTSHAGQKLLSLGRHKVFNWIDTESTFSIWLMQSLGQNETDAKSRSDQTNAKSSSDHDGRQDDTESNPLVK
jgi:hypothetical protein